MKQLYVVGIGPGNAGKMTFEADEVLHECEVIAGYKTYIDLIRDRFPDKEYIVNGMRKERERCVLALGSAAAGKTTAMICSGDAGVYGMAGIILELSETYADVDIAIIPGVTAALSGGAVLGAPLGHDFAVISLSDLLTPWDEIEKRLSAAAEADFAICIYNPSSNTRKEYLERACDVILRSKSGETICGYVKNIGRTGECARIVTLSELQHEELDMFTTVFIGNSKTRRIGDWMVTPRGYRA